MTKATKLSCRNVWKLYGANPGALLAANPNPTAEDLQRAGMIGAVRGATLDVAEGEIFVIMGLSGSGKSTLLRCLARLIEPDAGEVVFDGTDILAASDASMIELRRHKMGMVFQHFALLPHLTVLQNVMFPLTVQGVAKEAAAERAQEVINLVSLSGREDNYPRQLSGGQQQRVGIARSLVAEPELWFLDEPFSALDPLIRREMQDEFTRLQAQLHKTIIFITHDFDEAVRLADRIAIMQDGEIIQIATPEELVLNPATDYVAEFTRHIPRSKVLSVGAITDPALTGTGEPIVATTSVADVAERIIEAEAPVSVVDVDGQGIGAVDRHAVARILFADGQGG